MKGTVDIVQVLKTLKKQFPQPGAMELDDVYKTLVAVVLSARTRDEQVLKLLPRFFETFPSIESLARASDHHIETRISTIGMYRQKAKHLHRMARDVVERFHGTIPNTMDDLVTLAGVGRKTASVVLTTCFDVPAIAVDTHVHRIANRLGWVRTQRPEQTEQQLLKLVPTPWQRTVNRVFVKLGRYICLPGKPRCYLCPIQSFCQFSKKQLTQPKDAQSVQEDLLRRERVVEELRTQVL